MADRFNKTLVLVAGGTGALGKSVSLAFLNESASVVATYRNPGEFAALKNAAGDHSDRLQGHQADVTDEAAVRQLTDGVLRQGKPLTALVNAVGAYAGGISLWQTDPKVMDQMFALNFRSGYLLSRAVIPLMLKQGSGAIVNVSARAAFDHAAGAAAYAASKAASLAMIDSLAADLKGTGVRANSVLPNIFDTEANRKAMPDADFAKWPKPEDIAKVILFLCSDDARLINGAAIPVYGDT
jgi:NAD(P)-dependent dehydrogenase (short-subunit alcohol dehydrogenase family)